ncbi:MAG: hypothetical protein KDD41_12430 [Flavobacteriales bacterium]|nr:hypothetical protein [Flavobacteriales bacterium]
MELTDKHISEITTLIRAKGVEMEELLYDLVDHVCCMVEEKMEQGENYSSALEESMNSFGNNGIRQIQVETTYLLTKNILAMKKTMHIIGIAATLMLLAGAILKIRHLPGALAIYVAGGFFMNFVFLPLLVTVKVKEKLGKLRTWTTILGIASAFVLINGIFFKIMYWPYANMFMNIGGAMLLFIYLPLAIYAAVKRKDIRSNTLLSIILSVAGFCMLFLLVKVHNSHTVDRAIDNMQYTISQDVKAARHVNDVIFSGIHDTLKTEALRSLDQQVGKIGALIDELNLVMAKSQHPELTDEQLRALINENQKAISDDLGPLSMLNEGEKIQRLMALVADYEKGYQELTATTNPISYNKDNMSYYQEHAAEKFPLGIIAQDLNLLNLQVQRTHTSLLQYFKGRVS